MIDSCAITRARLALLDLASSGTTGEIFRAQALSQLMTLLPHDDACFVPFNADFLHSLPSFVLAFGKSAVYRDNLRKAFNVARKQRGAYIDSEVFSAAERERLPVFRDLIAPLGITSQLVAPISVNGRLTGMMHLNRHGGRAFRNQELAALQPLLSTIGVLHLAVEDGVLQASAESLWSRLTPREAEIADWVCRGYQSAQIAANLGRSVHTVNHQIAAIFRKCSALNRTELAVRLEGGRDAERAWLSSVELSRRQAADVIATMRQLRDVLEEC